MAKLGLDRCAVCREVLPFEQLGRCDFTYSWKSPPETVRLVVCYECFFTTGVMLMERGYEKDLVLHGY